MVLQGYQAEIPAKKLKRGHRKKNFWPNFGWFYQKQAEKGPQKIFKRCSLFLAVITVINLIFNIQYTNFLRPLFCLFLVKSAKIRPEIFFCGPFWAFWPEFLPGNLATLNSSGGLGGGRGVTCPTSPNSHLADTCRKISTWNTQSWDFRKIIILSLSLDCRSGWSANAVEILAAGTRTRLCEIRKLASISRFE